MWTWRIARTLAAIAAAVLLSALLAATLVRFAPGFDSDERQLDSRLSAGSQEALRAERAANRHILSFYAHYLARAAHGDLGTSQTLGTPVTELVRERLPVTLRLTGAGLLFGWLAAVALALAASAWRTAAGEVSATLVAGMFLCIPSAVLALATAFARTPAYLAVALVVFPRVFRYARNLLGRSYDMPHVLTARAKGLGGARVLFWHVLPTSAGQMLALAGVSVSIAFGACVPIETLCGVPGIGQLAWQAAIGRDLPLLVTLTAIVTVITLAANSGSDLLSDALRPQAA
jgi:peptide/nickel transport system permease protein